MKNTNKLSKEDTTFILRETVRGMGKGILVIPAILIAVAITKALFSCILAN